MPKAAELFQVNTSKAFGSNPAARRTATPRSASSNQPGGFGDILSKVSKSARKPAEDLRSDVTDDSKPTEPTRATEKPAAKGKAKKAAKTETRGRSAEDADESTETPDPAAEQNSTEAAAASSTEDAGDDAEAIDAPDSAQADEATDNDTTEGLAPELIAAAQTPAVQPSDAAEAQASCDADDEPASTDAPIEGIARSAADTGSMVKARAQGQALSQDGTEEAGEAHDPSSAPAAKPLAPRPQLRTEDSRGSGAEEELETAGNEAAAAKSAPTTAAIANSAFDQFAELFADAPAADSEAAAPDAKAPDAGPFNAGFTPQVNNPHKSQQNVLAAAPGAPEPAREARFADDNHHKIVNGVRGELLPNGGTMKLRLDPPELGTLQVSLHMRDGVVSAAFETPNGDAARLLSHTLSDLRTTLEAHGIVVDKLHVQQSPREDNDGGGTNHDSQQRGQTFEQQQDARRDQQRKDMVQKLWDRLAGLAPIDLVA